VALAELSRMELKDSARLLDLRRGPPWGQGGRRAPGGDGEGEESSASLTLLLRLRWTRQVCLATWIRTGDGLVQGLHPVSYNEGEVVPPP